ncbi:MAG: hypothetical protein K8U03_15125 [Planctomycetia bacterium]|nr:hypothetical protein [Planctomycetia bacterium]
MISTSRRLNRLLAIHCRSLPMYMLDAGSWQSDAPKENEFVQAMHNIVIGQKELSQRIATVIMDLGGVVSPGPFPMEFTDMNFLSLDFMVRETLGLQRRDIGEIEGIVRGVGNEPEAKAIAQEALGAAKAHLETLEALTAKQPVAT